MQYLGYGGIVYIGGNPLGDILEVSVDPVTVKDSGERQQFETGAQRDTQGGKGRFDLVQLAFLWEVAKVNEAGAVKYGDRNYQKGIPLGRYIDSAIRHLTKWVLGYRDEPHLAQAGWNIEKLWWTAEEIKAGRLPRSLDDGGYLTPDDLSGLDPQDGTEAPPLPEMPFEETVVECPSECPAEWREKGIALDVRTDPDTGVITITKGRLTPEDVQKQNQLEEAKEAAIYLLRDGPVVLTDFYDAMKKRGFDGFITIDARTGIGARRWRQGGLMHIGYPQQAPEGVELIP